MDGINVYTKEDNICTLSGTASSMDAVRTETEGHSEGHVRDIATLPHGLPISCNNLSASCVATFLKRFRLRVAPRSGGAEAKRARAVAPSRRTSSWRKRGLCWTTRRMMWMARSWTTSHCFGMSALHRRGQPRVCEQETKGDA